MLHFLVEPWPWYIGGPLLGLMVPILLFFGNRHFGISSSFRHICAAVLPKRRPEYFNYRWKDGAWNLFLIAGTIVGGIIAALFLGGTNTPNLSGKAQSMFVSWGIGNAAGLMPSAIYGLGHLFTLKSILMVCGGGFLIGFGARYANGCTAGHAIMGLSLLDFGSLVAVLGFFVGGLLVSNLLVPLVIGL